jgi:hypothetical protein
MGQELLAGIINSISKQARKVITTNHIFSILSNSLFILPFDAAYSEFPTSRISEKTIFLTSNQDFSLNGGVMQNDIKKLLISL